MRIGINATPHSCRIGLTAKLYGIGTSRDLQPAIEQLGNLDSEFDIFEGEGAAERLVNTISDKEDF